MSSLPYVIKREWREAGYCRGMRKMIITCPFCASDMEVNSNNLSPKGTGKRCPCGAKALGTTFTK